MDKLNKKDWRRILTERREAISPEERLRASQVLIQHFQDNFVLADHDVVSGFWPIKTEIDVRPLLTHLGEQGLKIALPRLENNRMVFKLWKAGDRLASSEFGLQEPLEKEPEIDPTFLLIPLLGFDAWGHRLGYGKGYYDFALENLRKKNKITAVGVAFACQEVEELPTEPQDQILDFILTEQGVTTCHPREGGDPAI